MLEFEIAAIYYYIESVLHIHPYFDEVPENLIVPCVFYPVPEIDTKSFSTNTFRTDFTMYVKIFDKSTSLAAEKASLIIGEIAGNRNKIPLVNDRGALTGKQFTVSRVLGSKADSGVYQIELSWKRYTSYTASAVTKAREFFINGVPLGAE